MSKQTTGGFKAVGSIVGAIDGKIIGDISESVRIDGIVLGEIDGL